jgi:hypothetical protein
VSPRALHFAPGLTVVAIAIVAVALACGSARSDHPCTAIAFADGIATDWAQARDAIDFEPSRPCARDGRLLVVAVIVDRMPAEGGGFVPRVSQVVARDGEQQFVFSETRAPVPFFAIPNGTRSLVVDLAGKAEPARGFVGTSPSGSAIAYLRWRADDVTRELAATLHPVFTEADLVALVRGTAASH